MFSKLCKAKLQLVTVIVGLFIICQVASAQTWQQVLDNNFDYAETFDQLQDWTGAGWGGVSSPSDMPVKLNGDPSIWEYYSYWNTHHDYNNTWIGFHGSENVWCNDGKSLCIDYGGNRGPSRLGFSIGDSPDDGYEEIYIFFMNKYYKKFFRYNADGFIYFPYLKTLQISTGFRDIVDWGTVEEQEEARDAPQQRHVYGLNDIIMNFITGSSCQNKLYGRYNVFCSDSNGYTYYQEATETAYDAEYTQFIESNEWFGIEYHFILSNPHGQQNGLAEIWVYDQFGNVTGHDTLNSIVTIQDAPEWPLYPPPPVQNHVFNHKYNKFVWGGNRCDYGNDFLNCFAFTANPATDIITVDAEGRETGEVVKISSDSLIPEPLETGHWYYIIVLSDSSVKFADSYSNAMNGTAIDILSAGAGTHYMSAWSNLYVDDIVMNSTRIGPTYFSLLGSVGINQAENDTPPKSFRAYQGGNAVTFSGDFNIGDSITIYDINGRMVHDSASYIETTYLWNLDGITSGIYLFAVQSTDGNMITSGKIVVIR